PPWPLCSTSPSQPDQCDRTQVQTAYTRGEFVGRKRERHARDARFLPRRVCAIGYLPGPGNLSRRRAKWSLVCSRFLLRDLHYPADALWRSLEWLHLDYRANHTCRSDLERGWD